MSQPLALLLQLAGPARRWGMARIKFPFTVFLLGSAIAANGQSFNVKIVQRPTSETGYTYQVAGHAYSNSTGNADCSGTLTNTGYGTANVDANCSGTTNTSTTYTAPREVSYTVTGATLSLLLPDGRTAVVNCVGKLIFGFPVTVAHHRSCKIPQTDEIEAEFKSKNAKLKWPVSVDGKKFESETYTILAILPK
jgi:hypothetical protein